MSVGLPALPRLTRAKIQGRADALRHRHIQDTPLVLPINIEAIIESLDIHIQPVGQLQSQAGVDAVISSDFRVIYVDRQQYEHPDGSYDNRLRFSMAHELAHLYLHRSYYTDLKIEGIEDALRFFAHLSDEDYHWIEWQSNEFAGRFLVPPDALIVCMREVLKQHQSELANNTFAADELLAAMAPEMGRHFGVSGDVILRRHSIEKIPDYFGTGFERGEFTLNAQKLLRAEELVSEWTFPLL